LAKWEIDHYSLFLCNNKRISTSKEVNVVVRAEFRLELMGIDRYSYRYSLIPYMKVSSTIMEPPGTEISNSLNSPQQRRGWPGTAEEMARNVP
jgi:hypothetical protein